MFRVYFIACGLMVQVACTLGGQEGEDLTPSGSGSTAGDTDSTTVVGTSTSTSGTVTTSTSLDDTSLTHTGWTDTGLSGPTSGGSGSCDRLGPILQWKPQATEDSQSPALLTSQGVQLRVAWSEDEQDPMRSQLQIFAVGGPEWTPDSDSVLSWRWPRGLGMVDVDGSAVGQDESNGEWLLFSGTLTAVSPTCWSDAQLLSVALTDGSGGVLVRHQTSLGELRLQSLLRPLDRGTR